MAKVYCDVFILARMREFEAYADCIVTQHLQLLNAVKYADQWFAKCRTGEFISAEVFLFAGESQVGKVYAVGGHCFDVRDRWHGPHEQGVYRCNFPCDEWHRYGRQDVASKDTGELRKFW